MECFITRMKSGLAFDLYPMDMGVNCHRLHDVKTQSLVNFAEYSQEWSTDVELGDFVPSVEYRSHKGVHRRLGFGG